MKIQDTEGQKALTCYNLGVLLENKLLKSKKGGIKRNLEENKI